MFHIAAGQRGARPLQGAVDRGDRGLQALGHFGGRPAEDFGQQQRRPLTRREVLQRRDEREPDALTQRRALVRIGVRRKRARIRDGLEPVRPRAIVERVVHRADRAFFHRTGTARAVGQRVQAHVGRDPVQPRPQRRAPFEALEASPGADHGFLHRVLRVDGRTEHAVAVTGQS